MQVESIHSKSLSAKSVLLTSNGRQINSYLILLTLAIGSFAIGVTEFSPMGFLPQIADGISVSIPKAGLLISGYALGVMVGAPIMTLWFGRFSRRLSLILLMIIFTGGNVLASIAPNYTVLMIARVITSFNHGAFFGIGSVVAASVVPKHKQASAIAMMFMGLTIANIFGVPFATWLGQNIGWERSFMAISILGIVTIVALFSFIPQGMQGNRVDVKSEVREMTQLSVILALLTTVVSAGAMFTLYTYIAPVLQETIDAQANSITLALVVIGIGFSLGNWLAGKIADLALIRGLFLFLTALTILMLLIPIIGHHSIIIFILLFLWGMASFGVVPFLQVIVMNAAQKAPALASSINIGAFNLGNALGAALGGLVIELEFPYQDVSFMGAGLAVIAIILLLAQFGRKLILKQGA